MAPEASPHPHALKQRIRELEEQNRELVQSLAGQKEAHKMLAKMIRRIADNVPDMIWAKDLDNRYLFANRALCAGLLMCRSPEAAAGHDDVHFAELERAQGHRHTFGEVCVNSDEAVKTAQKAMRFVEDGLVRGQYLVLDVHKAPLLDEGGNLVGTVGCGRDITREQQIQKDLEASRVSQQLLMETRSDNLSEINTALKVLLKKITNMLDVLLTEILSYGILKVRLSMVRNIIGL